MSDLFTSNMCFTKSCHFGHLSNVTHGFFAWVWPSAQADAMDIGKNNLKSMKLHKFVHTSLKLISYCSKIEEMRLKFPKKIKNIQKLPIFP